MRIKDRLRQLANQDLGATATEYALVLALVALALLVGVSALGGAINGLLQGQAAQLAAMPVAGSVATGQGAVPAVHGSSSFLSENWPETLALFVPAGVAWLVLKRR